MNLIRYRGLPHIRRQLANEFVSPFERMFDDVFRQAFPEFTKEFGITPFSDGSYPKVNVVDFDDRVEVVAELAGYSKDDVSVEVDKDNILCISGTSSTKEEAHDDSRYIVRELKRSKFSRSFTITEQLDPKGVSASFENGLLTVTIPKTKKSEPEVRRKVEIK